MDVIVYHNFRTKKKEICAELSNETDLQPRGLILIRYVHYFADFRETISDAGLYLILRIR